MIAAPKHRNDHLASAWMTGIALAVLVVGGYGAAQPLLPGGPEVPDRQDRGEEVMLEDFALTAPPAAEAMENPPPVELPDMEIPPLPVIEPPVQPPEMPDLLPLEKPPPATVAPPPPKPRPQAVAKPDAGGAVRSMPGSGDGAPTLFTGGGGGRFPAPAYPAFARSAKQQGTVRLLVTVESSGVPSSVEVQSSSGFSSLDAAARDQITRRWRWPAGGVRHFIVPVRFVLQ